jgi:hypothetical protein
MNIKLFEGTSEKVRNSPFVVAVTVFSILAATIAPAPSGAELLFSYGLAVAGGFAGIAIGSRVTATTATVGRMAAHACLALLSAILCAILYYSMFNGIPTPTTIELILEATLYVGFFVGLFALARMADVRISE